MLKKQELVTLSTMEAEYVGATHAAKELIWFRGLIREIFRPLNNPTVLYLDNQSAIKLSNSDGQFHAHSKHIDIQYHFIKFCIQDQFIVLFYCPTEDMIADILTKSIPLIKLGLWADALHGSTEYEAYKFLVYTSHFFSDR